MKTEAKETEAEVEAAVTASSSEWALNPVELEERLLRD